MTMGYEKFAEAYAEKYGQELHPNGILAMMYKNSWNNGSYENCEWALLELCYNDIRDENRRRALTDMLLRRYTELAQYGPMFIQNGVPLVHNEGRDNEFAFHELTRYGIRIAETQNIGLDDKKHWAAYIDMDFKVLGAYSFGRLYETDKPIRKRYVLEFLLTHRSVGGAIPYVRRIKVYEWRWVRTNAGKRVWQLVYAKHPHVEDWTGALCIGDVRYLTDPITPKHIAEFRDRMGAAFAYFNMDSAYSYQYTPAWTHLLRTCTDKAGETIEMRTPRDMYTCSDCGCELDLDEDVHYVCMCCGDIFCEDCVCWTEQDDPYCDSCYVGTCTTCGNTILDSQYYYTCRDCGEYVCIDCAVHTNQGTYCAECFSDLFYTCDWCGNTCASSDSVFDDLDVKDDANIYEAYQVYGAIICSECFAHSTTDEEIKNAEQISTRTPQQDRQTHMIDATLDADKDEDASEIETTRIVEPDTHEWIIDSEGA